MIAAAGPRRVSPPILIIIVGLSLGAPLARCRRRVQVLRIGMLGHSLQPPRGFPQKYFKKMENFLQPDLWSLRTSEGTPTTTIYDAIHHVLRAMKREKHQQKRQRHHTRKETLKQTHLRAFRSQDAHKQAASLIPRPQAASDPETQSESETAHKPPPAHPAPPPVPPPAYSNQPAPHRTSQ